MVKVRLNHIALDVSDRARSIAFYHDLVGAEPVAEDVPHRITFLRLPGSPNYNDIALHEHRALREAYPDGVMRMAHAGFAVEDAAALVAGFDFFRARSRVLMAADFGVSWSVMGADPDGHTIELELFHATRHEEQPGFAKLDIEALRRRAP